MKAKRHNLIEEERNYNLTKKQPTAVTQKPDWKMFWYIIIFCRVYFCKTEDYLNV